MRKTEDKKRKSKPRGFTLVELLTASVIGGFVAVIAVGGLHAIGTGRDKLEDHADAAAELRYVESVIRRDLSNIYRDSDDTQRRLVGMVKEEGDRLTSRIVFYTTRWSPVREEGIEGDVCEVDYGLMEDQEGWGFYRRLWPNPDERMEPGGVVRRVSERVTAFGVRYHDGKEWRLDWPEKQQQLPRMIEVGLAVESEPGSVLESQFVMNFSRWPRGQRGDGNR